MAAPRASALPPVALLVFFSLVAAALVPPKPANGQAAGLEVDVLVYGGTSGGVMAAYAARREGKSVLLVEPGRHLGGVTSGGLGQTDVGDTSAVTGLARDFYRRVGRAYGAEGEVWNFEPHVAERVFWQYVNEAGVEVLLSRRAADVRKEGAEIEAVTLEYAGGGAGGSGLVVEADVFVDASYEGDLMALAGVSYAVGRESNAAYGERYNGVQRSRTRGAYGRARVEPEYPAGIDPYVVPGDPASGLLPEVMGTGLAEVGSGDRAVQAYTFRMCLCQGEAALPLSEPAGYDAARYELLARMMAAEPWKSLRDGFQIHPMPNGKTDWNNKGGYGLSTDYIGGSWAYPEAGYAARDSIWQAHEDYQKGLLWFVATDRRVPEPIREAMRSWGYCPDEFLDTGGWPHALYVREARRMVGAYVMTERDALRRTALADGVAFASYPIDSHNVRRAAVEGELVNDGNTFVGSKPLAPYPVSYRALTPKREEAANLLVTFALSASHSAFGSIRMEPVFMALSEAAGVAAALALEAGGPVQEVDPARLRDRLLGGGRPPE